MKTRTYSFRTVMLFGLQLQQITNKHRIDKYVNNISRGLIMLQKGEKVWKYRVNIPHILRTEHNCARSTNSFIFEQSLPPPARHTPAHHWPPPHHTTTGGKYSSTVLAFQSKTTRDMLSTVFQNIEKLS